MRLSYMLLPQHFWHCISYHSGYAKSTCTEFCWPLSLLVFFCCTILLCYECATACLQHQNNPGREKRYVSLSTHKQLQPPQMITKLTLPKVGIGTLTMLLTSKLSCLSCGYVIHAGIGLQASSLIIEESFTPEDSWLDTAFTLPANPPPAAQTPPQPHLPNGLSDEGYAPWLPYTSTRTYRAI